MVSRVNIRTHEKRYVAKTRASKGPRVKPSRRTESKEDITLAEWAPLADITEDDKESGNVKAEFKDGMLTVHLSKSEKAKPKQREVAVA